MDKPELIQLLRIAHDEILQQRRRIDELEPKAHAYDTVAAAVRLNVREDGGYAGVDTAWRIAKAIEELQAVPVVEKEENQDA